MPTGAPLMSGTRGPVVLILGSGPNALTAASWPKGWFDRIVVINNAWRIRADWDDHVFPEDFPVSRRPPAIRPEQRRIEADDFVPAQNLHGGFIHAGATMAFTAAYWALVALRPSVMAFMGCDMVYPDGGQTHFYGMGRADPLRKDVSLRDLGAKSARLGVIAGAAGCHCLNLSEGESRLLFPRARPMDLLARRSEPGVDRAELADLQAREAALRYETPDGRYDTRPEAYDLPALDAIDAAWRRLYAGFVT